MAYEIVIGRSKEDRARFGLDGTILLGKHYVQMGQTTALSNRVFLDMVRSHVVFVCGKRGSGKCLLGETLITLANGERVPIKQLEERTENVIGLDEHLKITPRQREGFYKRTVENLLRLTFRTGKEITLTPEHPLLTILGWRPAQNLLIGSRVATPRSEPIFGDHALPEHQVKLIAYLLAEGHLKKKMVLFSNSDAAIVQDFTTAVGAFGSDLRVRQYSRPHCYTVTGRTPIREHINIVRNKKGQFAKGTRIDNRSAIRRWLDDVGMYGKLARERTMPSCIYTLPKHQLRLFLNRLFSCDGCIHRRGPGWWQVSYSTSSKGFAEAVAHLLLRFGIVSRLRKKYSKEFRTYSYELVVSGQFVYTYLQEIGFFGKKEERAARGVREALRIKWNPNTDTIPIEIWRRYQPESWTTIGRAVGYKHPKAMREATRYAPSRQKLLQIAIADESDPLQDLATSDIFWDELVKIEKLHGSFTVYDITVPETHNFVANDIIVHNSWTLGVLAEGMADLPEHIKGNLSIIMLDTMGVFWTMKYPNVKEKELLRKWDMEPKALDVTIFTPLGQFERAKAEGIPADRPFAIRPSELLGSDWATTFELEPNSAPAVLIERVVHDLREAEGDAYDISDILAALEKSRDADQTTRAVVRNHFLAAQSWGIFSNEGTPLTELAVAGQVSILDLSAYATQEHGWAIKALVTGIVSQKLFLERMQARKGEEFRQVYRDVHYLAPEDELDQRFPLVWLVLDEAHEFLPNQGRTLATDPLVTILREGRQPGISLVLASQQPGKIHTDVMTQADVVISHRITAKLDTDALGLLMQSYLRQGLDKILDGLPRTSGAAIVLDDSNEKMFPLQIRPRFTWHGGSSPTALKEERKLFEF